MSINTTRQIFVIQVFRMDRKYRRFEMNISCHVNNLFYYNNFTLRLLAYYLIVPIYYRYYWLLIFGSTDGLFVSGTYVNTLYAHACTKELGYTMRWILYPSLTLVSYQAECGTSRNSPQALLHSNNAVESINLFSSLLSYWFIDVKARVGTLCI